MISRTSDFLLRIFSCLVIAQTAPASYDVASIKPNHSGAMGEQIRFFPPSARVTMTNITVKRLIQNAYQLQDSQIAGGPGWISSEHFDIVANAEGVTNPTPPERWRMMRALLAFIFCVVVSGAASAADFYPSRPIRLLVPFPPAGITDLSGRIVAEGLRAKLEAQRTTCVLFDTPRYVRHLEAAFEEMWRRYCAGEKPASKRCPLRSSRRLRRVSPPERDSSSWSAPSDVSHRHKRWRSRHEVEKTGLNRYLSTSQTGPRKDSFRHEQDARCWFPSPRISGRAARPLRRSQPFDREPYI